jgi:superfamily II DNA or RNA helicase
MSYLGQKGYTIPKEILTMEQQYFIREELTIKPFVQGPVVTQAVTFPAYRESANKFYVPRYFGEEHFGQPLKMKTSPGHAIDVPFVGELRENQKPVVKAYFDHVSSGSEKSGSEKSGSEKSGSGTEIKENLQLGAEAGTETGGGLLELPCAYGKTILSLYILSKLSVKTLIIVHKEFLLNQWIERIQQFLPSARIGRIQGQILDIENKDIVIGMLQSLSMKDYHETTFQSFGLTIIDEVHHISSEVFSCALFKIVTRYMLGLSATMNRKDGTTKVFKMFLGPVVYKGKRDDEHEVTVRAIDYKANDEEFNNVQLDFRGNVQYSTLISKLCTYNHRTEFILKIVKDMLEENPNQQIMILAHNKNILKYMHDAIKTRNISSVGYYIGGMKEQSLKESETKKVVIATYSMAAEALDIKTLTTLIMATPKTEIEQAVGRILREKHSSPVVVDIIDSHAPFQNQWAKRKVFYKKQNYKIIKISNDTYTPDISKWKQVAIATKEKSNNDLPGKCLIKVSQKQKHSLT